MKCINNKIYDKILFHILNFIINTKNIENYE